LITLIRNLHSCVVPCPRLLGRLPFPCNKTTSDFIAVHYCRGADISLSSRMYTLNGKLATCILFCTSSRSVNPKLQESNTLRPAIYSSPSLLQSLHEPPRFPTRRVDRIILRCCYTLLTALTARQNCQQCVLHYICHRGIATSHYRVNYRANIIGYDCRPIIPLSPDAIV
jgi:hypothetical protein